MFFNKTAPLFRALRRVRNARLMSGGHDVPAHFKPLRQICEENKSHMNFMPVPQGSWHDAYNKINSQNNTLLAASVVSLVVTYAVLYFSGCIYLHGAPPAYTCKKKL